MPKISVIVPVYNVEKYLHNCVDSILAQTYQDFELILVDDGSPDNCGRICDEYAQKDPRIIVIHQENGGVSAARNIGLDWAFANSDSEWLSFVDSDDWVEPTYLADLLEAFQFPEVDISMGSYRELPEKDRICLEHEKRDILLSGREACRIYNCPEEWDDMCCGKMDFISCWNELFRKELFADIRFPVGMIHEEEATTYKVLYRARKIKIVDKVLYNYRINPEGITHGEFRINRFDTFEMQKEAEAFYLQKGEIEIACLAAKRRKAGQVRYLLKAHEAGIYNQVPRKYRMKLAEMEKIMGRDAFEYALFPYYPKRITIQCYFRKICQILGIQKYIAE